MLGKKKGVPNYQPILKRSTIKKVKIISLVKYTKLMSNSQVSQNFFRDSQTAAAMVVATEKDQIAKEDKEKKSSSSSLAMMIARN